MSASRNAREGRYVGHSKGKHWRLNLNRPSTLFHDEVVYNTHKSGSELMRRYAALLWVRREMNRAIREALQQEPNPVRSFTFTYPGTVTTIGFTVPVDEPYLCLDLDVPRECRTPK